MALNVWSGQSTAVAQVTTAQITGFHGATTYKITLTDDNGDTVVISALGDTNVNDTATALKVAWEASTDPRIAEITGTVASDTVTLTMDNAGQSFVVASSVTGASGTIGSATTSTTNVGPNDWSVPSNWSLNAIPVDTNDVDIPAGTPAILYGLNQSGVELADFKRLVGHSNNIGRFFKGFAYHLRIDPNLLEDYGSAPLTMYDIAAGAYAPFINNSGTPTSGRHTVYLKGTGMTGLDILNGNVGVGTESDDTTTSCDIFRISGGTTAIGEDVDSVDNSDIGEIQLSAGTVYCNSPVKIVTQTGGTYYQNKGTWTTQADLYGGTTYPDATGVYVLTTVNKGASFLNTNDKRLKTLTNITIEAGATVSDPLRRFIYTNDAKYPDGIHDCTLNLGTNIQFKVVVKT